MLWLPPFSLAELVRPVGQAYGPEHGLGRQIARLDLRARLAGLAMHFDGDGIAFHGTVSGAASSGHKGVPTFANADLSFGGHQGAVRAHFDSRDMLVAFPEYLSAYDEHQRASGVLTLVHGNGRVGLRGEDLAVQSAGTRATGRFSLARRHDEPSHVAVDGHVDAVPVDNALEYVPLTLPGDLRDWLLRSVRAGDLADMRIVYQGRAKVEDALPWRRFELVADVAGATVAYHPEWPIARRVEGLFTMTARNTTVRGQAEAFGVALPELDVRIRNPLRGGGAPRSAEVSLVCDTSVARLVDFARATPVREGLPFLSDEWSGAGPVRVAADLRIPLDGSELRPGDVKARFHFDEAELDMADIGLHFEAVNDAASFEYPTRLTSDGLEAELFGAPTTIRIASDASSVRFDVSGTATPADAYRLLGVDELAVAEGVFPYDARFTVFPASDRAMELAVESDLDGLAVRLPKPLHKAPEERRALAVSMQFLEPHVAVSASYGDTSGWLHAAHGRILAGSIGVGGGAPMVDPAAGRLVLGGGVEEIDSATMAALLSTPDAEAPLAWGLRRFRVGKMTLDTFEITQAELSGFSDGDEVRFAVAANELTGTIAKTADAPWRVAFSELRLPTAATDGDPLSPAVHDRLLAADVTIDRVWVGDEDYGSWRLGLRPDANGVMLTDLVADVRGLKIESVGEVYWSRSNETRFQGTVDARNVYEVLPLWGFAPSVESESFHAAGLVRWPGSPLNFDLAHLSGQADLRVENGRFLDIAPGATPILSLVNFSTIVKRMSLDFSDVFGAGVSFEIVLAELAVDDGLARFTKAAEIVGTGSSFRVAGTVDLDSGMLDNEMVVTLPLHSSLPWYAAFLALSNPAGAAAVVVGRQVFKDQLRRLTSGKYRIRGTYEEPEVEFVGIFVDDVTVAPAVAPTGVEAVDGGEQADVVEPPSPASVDAARPHDT